MEDSRPLVEFEGVDGNQEFANICAAESSYYRIEHWYPDIKEWTFATTSIPLSMPEALIIKKYSERLYQILLFHDLVNKRQIAQWDENRYNLASDEVRKELTIEEINLLKQLEQRIDEVIKNFPSAEGAFVKLSTRSPKDSAFSLQSMKQLIEADIKNSTFVGGTTESNTEDITIFYRASCKCLRVYSGSDAVTLLIRSKRVQTDIVFAELSVDTKDSIPLSLVIREWNDKILPEWEFRVFVFNNKLTAATQYTDVLYIPEMAAKKNEIKTFIQKFWNKVKDNIKCESYTIDLALDPSLESAYIVELNPPPPVAGCSLFDWSKPADRAQIESGTEFELRIADSLKPTARDEIHQPLRKYMDELRGLPPIEDPIYKWTSCSSCSRHPITKTFYHCDVCEDYDVCVDCLRAGAHSKMDHGLQKIVFGEEIALNLPKPANSESESRVWFSWCIIS